MKKEKHPKGSEGKEALKQEETKQDVAKDPVNGAPDAPAGNESSATEEQKLVDEVEELRKQSEENFNKFARMSADFDNFRKRVAKERDEIYQVALEGLMKDLLPVVDNFERAAGSFASEGLDQKYIDGLDMIMKQLLGALTKNGLSEIDATNDFDPNFHHAIMQEPGEEDDKITMVLQKGYTLGNKVIRPSMVKVSVKE